MTSLLRLTLFVLGLSISSLTWAIPQQATQQPAQAKSEADLAF